MIPYMQPPRRRSKPFCECTFGAVESSPLGEQRFRTRTRNFGNVQMKDFRLQFQHESLKLLSEFFSAGAKEAQGSIISLLEVCEDICFGTDKWLSIGQIELHPAASNTPGESENPAYESVKRALSFGSYGWKLPALDTLSTQATDLVSEKHSKKTSEEKKARLAQALEAIPCAAIRCGLAHPVFDADSVADMPFRKPTTVVADTSSVLQGGLDFVVRFLYPYARVKIPAVVHMEILNMVERYLTQRRKQWASGSTLYNHVTSQGGQRVLLRLELQTDVEIERPRMGSDPLRGIIQADKDQEDRNLGLQEVQRSFADRLILETAIQQRERLSPDHTVMLLTCDQGLARMALAEGIQPLFFDKNYCSKLFGTTLTGTCFSPFVSPANSDRLYFVPLTELLWELAVTFGAVRVANEEHSASVEVHAIGESLSWSPFHAKEDLLWVKSNGFDIRTRSSGKTKEVYQVPADLIASELPKEASLGKLPTKSLGGSYKFSLPAMLLLIQAFIEKGRLTDRDGSLLVGVKTLDSYEKYRNFLRSGDFVKPAAGGFEKTDRLERLWGALLRRGHQEAELLLSEVPSFKAFKEELLVKRPVALMDLSSVSSSAASTYRDLAEVVCVALHIPDAGLYGTSAKPTLEEFSRIAVQSYEGLSKGEEYVLTGQWLEALARDHSVHPVESRNRLDEAFRAGYLERYTEGSTPDTRFEKHVMSYLDIDKGLPVIKRINLYHGDFVIPERASVSIRIIKKEK